MEPLLERVAKAPRFRGNPFLRAYARQKFFPPNIPLGTKFGAEPRTRPYGLAHSQRQISLYVSRPYAHVIRAGLFQRVFNGLFYSALTMKALPATAPPR